MKKIYLVVIASLLCNMLFVRVHELRAAVDQSSIVYLQSLKPDDWNTMALAASGNTPASLEHLKTLSGTSATDYARNILAITSTGNDPRTFAGVDRIAQLKTFYINGQIGDTTLLNDDFWGILALISAGESSGSEIIQGAKNFILQNQGSEGGWSYAVGVGGDTNDSAMAVSALLEAGVSVSSEVITKAVDFIKNVQNIDGGFPFTNGGESDAGSDAWVISMIYKLGQDPTTWKKLGRHPVEHLESLKNEDGSYKWMARDTNVYPIMTSYAVIALAGKSYPVGRITAPKNNDDTKETQTVNYRIEGSNKQICAGTYAGVNPLQLVKDEAARCGYTYEIKETAFGPYLNVINSDIASGITGWMYLVNYESPLVGANDYVMKTGDTLIWFFDTFDENGNMPTRIAIAKTKVEPNETVTVTVEFYDNGNWSGVPSGKLSVAGQEFAVSNGTATLQIATRGVYYFSFDDSSSTYIRSEQETLKVGVDDSQPVDMRVNVLSSSGSGGDSEPQVAFTVSDTLLDFTSLKPGQASQKTITVQNLGNASIRVEANVTGDELFTSPGNLTFNAVAWKEFILDVSIGGQQNVESKLTIPSSYTGVGIKTGQVIFWATAK